MGDITNLRRKEKEKARKHTDRQTCLSKCEKKLKIKYQPNKYENFLTTFNPK